MNLQREIDSLIAERASQWLETLRGADKSQHAEFVRWIGESPRHLREFMALLALKQELPKAFELANIDRDALLDRVAAGARARNLAARESAPHVPPGERKESRRWTTPWRIAAALVLALGATLWIGTTRIHQTFATDVGEQRTITLDDGSLLSMNAHSRVRVKFNGAARDIELLEGEALFQVARDAPRPFTVHTKDATVRALGTQFNVNMRPTRTVISVLEGKVEISGDATAQTASKEPLVAGEAAEVTPEGAIKRRPPIDTASAAAWRQRELVFENTPLEDVAADFNRFHDKGRLVLEDVQPGTHHYTGAFNADDVASFVAMLQRQPDLRVEVSAGDFIVRRAESARRPE